ncbi:ABC transporter permease [Arthrobacter roseus]|uniref:ABC transporter permease n=1 Tax=Arthrobacter roseus TaxID=136274 RepID=UPI0019639D46|nr:ABC transporter permease [Arthrobacter roseus]MBM7848932.1 putative ABC transport system permease protein [Arthrobacter roseus]
MLQIALSQLRTHYRRFLAVALAVILGVGFLSATLMVGGTTTASLQNSIGATYAKADLVINSLDGLPDEALAAVAEVDGVSGTYAVRTASAPLTSGNTATSAMLQSLSPVPSMEPVSLAKGDFPAAANEVTVDSDSSQDLGLDIGDTVELGLAPSVESTPAEDGAPLEAAPTRDVLITGITVPSAQPYMAGAVQIAATDTLLSAVAGPDALAQSAQLKLAVDADMEATTSAVTAALSANGTDGATVLTAEEQTLSDVAALSGGQDQLTIVLLAFSIVAILVTALVISNTFSVLVAQRTRELGLLRCIGADRKQIRNSVLVEAAIVGFVSSVLGVLLAAGVMALLVGWVAQNPDTEFATLAIPASAVATGISVGLVMTLAAAYLPARAATAVAPLAALRPAEEAGIRNKRGRIRLGIGLFLALVGAVLLAYGASTSALLVALPGGLLSFLGVLLCAGLFVPSLVSVFGRAASPLGVPGKLAAVNAVRNPGRTTATATALLVGVTLVTMMMTGAQTSRNSFNQELAGAYPVDLSISEVQDESSASKQALDLAGVTATAVLAPAGSSDDGMPVYSGSAADVTSVLRDDSVQLTDGMVLVPKGFPASEITVTGATATLTLPVTQMDTYSFTPLMTTATAAQLGSAPADMPGEVWIGVDDSLDAAAIMDLRSELVERLGIDEYQVSGAAIERATFNQIIDVLLLVVTGLLAIAVLIALIGVANTLSLSVLERTRESSLLRALGLTRGQLRGMLAVEAVLIAGVAALIGCVLGSVYGWLGAQAALGSFAIVEPSVPWLQLAAVLAVAVVAGLLASVLPARRAAKLSPVEGLAAQ